MAMAFFSIHALRACGLAVKTDPIGVVGVGEIAMDGRHVVLVELLLLGERRDMEAHGAGEPVLGLYPRAVPCLSHGLRPAALDVGVLVGGSLADSLLPVVQAVLVGLDVALGNLACNSSFVIIVFNGLNVYLFFLGLWWAY